MNKKKIDRTKYSTKSPPRQSQASSLLPPKPYFSARFSSMYCEKLLLSSWS